VFSKTFTGKIILVAFTRVGNCVNHSKHFKRKNFDQVLYVKVLSDWASIRGTYLNDRIYIFDMPYAFIFRLVAVWLFQFQSWWLLIDEVMNYV